MTGLHAFLPPSDWPADKAFVPDVILEVRIPCTSESHTSQSVDQGASDYYSCSVFGQIACIATNADLEPLDEGVEYVVRTDKAVLDNMNEW